MQHKRKNIRLHGYDYSRAGLYFLTVVVQNRLHLFGYVENGKMILNDAGRMIEQWYREIENKYPDRRCREMVVMPNHFHCIIENVEMPTDDDVPYRDGDVRTTDDNARTTDTNIGLTDAHVGAPLRGRPLMVDRPEPDEKYGMHNKKYGATIGDVMDWFKTMTTNEYIRGVKNNNWERFDGKLWQRNYYDRIIRDWEEDVRISTYILENPEKWNDDKFNSNE
jgi:REP element-mobilizing transposase RayT